MAEKKCGYAGKISHAGVQKVEAPMGGSASKGKSSVKKGNDMRTGK